MKNPKTLSRMLIDEKPIGGHGYRLIIFEHVKIGAMYSARIVSPSGDSTDAPKKFRHSRTARRWADKMIRKLRSVNPDAYPTPQAEMETQFKFTVEFATGYEASGEIDRKSFESSEYWIAVTERQNPYDLLDEPVAIIVNGTRVPLDDDGFWMSYFDEAAAAVWPGAEAYS